MDKLLVCGELEVAPNSYKATLRGEALPLTPSQVEVLATLLSHSERVVTRAELARSAGLDPSTVDVVLTTLRRVLGDGFVRNVRSRGWILERSAFEG